MAFGSDSTAEQVTEGLDLTGQTWLITGSNSGLGKESARVLAMRGAAIIAGARTEEKARAALDDLDIEGHAIACELSDLASVRAAVETVRGLPKLHGIMANAGIMALPELRQQSGYELQFFVNHVGHFQLITGLLDHVEDGGRIVVLSSEAHRNASEGLELDNLNGERDYAPWRAYGRSKLANILFARELAKRAGRGITVNSLHPGVIETNLARNMDQGEATSLFDSIRDRMKTVAQGAATQCYLAVHPEVAETTGQYFDNCAPREPIPAALDDALATELWERTEAIVGEA